MKVEVVAELTEEEAGTMLEALAVGEQIAASNFKNARLCPDECTCVEYESVGPCHYSAEGLKP